MLISNKYKRFLTGEWGGKASKGKEQYGSGKKNLETVISDKSIKYKKKKDTLYNIGEKVVVSDTRTYGRKLGGPITFFTGTIVDILKTKTGKFKYNIELSSGDHYVIGASDISRDRKMYEHYTKTGFDINLI